MLELPFYCAELLIRWLTFLVLCLIQKAILTAAQLADAFGVTGVTSVHHVGHTAGCYCSDYTMWEHFAQHLIILCQMF